MGHGRHSALWRRSLLRSWQETHHIVAAGCRYNQRGIFRRGRPLVARGAPDRLGPSRGVFKAAGGYRMVYRLGSCRRTVSPRVAQRSAEVFARAFQHLFLVSRPLPGLDIGGCLASLRGDCSEGRCATADAMPGR